MRHRFIIASYTIGFCALTSAAFADPSQSERDRARELMAAGRTQRTASDLPAALKSFAAANEIMHVPTTLFEVAATQSALGQLMAARDTLKDLARLPSDADEPDAFKKARHTGYELLTSIEQRIPTLDVSIQGDLGSRSSALSIDGRPSVEGREFSHIQLDPGKHQLVATSGGSKREQSISLTEGDTQHIEIVLESKRTDTVPLEATQTPAATPAEDSPPWALYTLAGLGVAGLGAGLGFVAEAKHVKSSLEQSCAPDCTTQQANRVGHWTTAANVSFGVGSAAIVAAVVVFVVQSSHSDAPGETDSRSLAFDVLPSPQGATFQAGGRF